MSKYEKPEVKKRKNTENGEEKIENRAKNKKRNPLSSILPPPLTLNFSSFSRPYSLSALFH